MDKSNLIELLYQSVVSNLEVVDEYQDYEETEGVFQDVIVEEWVSNGSFKYEGVDIDFEVNGERIDGGYYAIARATLETEDEAMDDWLDGVNIPLELDKESFNQHYINNK